MQNTFLVALALFTGAVANAQTSSPAQSTDTTVASTTMTDTSVGQAYVPHPERLQGIKTETLTSAHVFPALGTYKGSGSSMADVIVTLDSVNKGIVWVDGLPQGKFKAILKKAPSTYKIPMQTSANGKAVSEGTLYVSPGTNELTIVLGRPYNDANPTTSLTIDPKKGSGWQYTGTKTDAAVASPATPKQ